VRFTFPSLKNDHMHQGQVTLVTADNSELCLVKITELYIQWSGYGWGQEGGDPYVPACQDQERGSRHNIDGRTAANSSKTRKELKKLLEDKGEKSQEVKDKSFKMMGVTGTLEAGTSAEEVALHGR
jgi:hypothetical protein